MPTDESTLLDVSEAGGAARSLAPRLSLVVSFGQTAELVSLERDTPLVIGRAAPADLVVPAPKLSRTHARFTWSGEGVLVEDLGSTNGTRRDGERIREAQLLPGDAVRLGPVSVSVHRIASPATALAGIEPYERFLARVEDELVRARTLLRGCALLMIQRRSGDAHVGTLIPRLRGLLRPIDRLAIYGENAILALLPETDRERAVAMASQVASLEPRVGIGVALGAASAEELVDEARAAARDLDAGARVKVADDEPRAGEGEPVFVSPKMVALAELVERVARARIPVLLTGETGSGKEIVARAIHAWSTRSEGPLRVVNCGAIPPNLLEATLFGHEKGAFTGADRERAGLFEQADGGSLFLDEVGELSAAAQVALLRVLETQTLTRLGGSDEIEVDVRLIAATHRDLEAAVEEGSFRQDLLFRLNPMTVRIPPLRERREDLDPLIDRFLREAARGTGLPLKALSDEARAMASAYAWPGNVRELRNVIERAVVVCLGDVIGPDDLPEKLHRGAGEPAVAAEAELAAEPDADFKTRVRAYEIRLIVDALRRSGGNQTAAAALLRMPLRTLVHKIKAYDLRE